MKAKNLWMATFVVSLAIGLLLSVELARSIKTASNAAGTVKVYLESLVAKDRSGALRLTCPSWEMQAATEFDSFGAVSASLDNVSCIEVGSLANGKQVVCEGQIAFNYTGETRTLDLSRRTYVVTPDGICGYR